MSKTLSIITVVYNNAKGLRYTLDCLSNQSFQDFECIVVDGGSTDGTLDVIQEYSNLVDKHISEADKGIYDAMNKGIDMATGDWLTFLNSDDAYTSSSILNTLFAQPLDHYDFFYSDMMLLDPSGKPVRPLKAERLSKWTISKGMIACHQGMFVRRTHCPRYSETLNYQGDLNWTMDILDTVPANRVYYQAVTSVFYKSGGYSDIYIMAHLKAHLRLIYNRYGLLMIFWRLPRLLRRYLGKWARQALGIQTFRFWLKQKN